ncbi:hypothetical protein [Guptibacillus algicola]|uniref:hypothetical protein n=1 Tax=Guptibacillus algicola TaxID=225844 RepID=UPI001CD402CE|nr:hypothetical protein [Alkalihalobacillus algicola]MCA0985696.1 hypothetical protein [Alkalihalobacillus algicola]
MRKLFKFIMITLAIVSSWFYFESLKEEKAAEKLLEGLTTNYEGFYRISCKGDLKKLEKEFNGKFNAIYREHRDILDGYDTNRNPPKEVLDILNIKKTPICLVLDHKEIIYRTHTLKDLDHYLNELEEKVYNSIESKQAHRLFSEDANKYSLLVIGEKGLAEEDGFEWMEKNEITNVKSIQRESSLKYINEQYEILDLDKSPAFVVFNTKSIVLKTYNEDELIQFLRSNNPKEHR